MNTDPTPVPPGWVDKCCEETWIWHWEQAKGLLKMHDTCTPPCPRWLAATAYLSEERDQEVQG